MACVAGVFAVGGCGGSDSLPDVEQSLTFSGSVEGHLTRGVNVHATRDTGSNDLTMTQCAIYDSVDNSAGRTHRYFTATIVGDLRPDYRVALQLWTDRDSDPAYQNPGQVYPLTSLADLHLPDRGQNAPPLRGTGDPAFGSTIMYDADHKSGTINAWLGSLGLPRDQWINVAGHWRCG
ncbi:hypothetical protein [Nocardia sp. NPDC050175]|uniref:hypothetical protein n=1 Tax=Nocardia sp. NPDC050175 TaxID=3364317 RepID=UPI00378F5CB1